MDVITVHWSIYGLHWANCSQVSVRESQQCHVQEGSARISYYTGYLCAN